MESSADALPGVGDQEVAVVAPAVEEKVEQKYRPASICKMFSLATPLELLLFLVGVIGSAGHGVSQPVVCLLFGNLIDSLGGSSDSMMNAIRDLCIQMCWFGLGTVGCAALQGYCFKTFSELQVQKMRLMYFDVVLHKDIGWYDTQEIASLPMYMNDDVEKFAEAFGDKLGSSLMSFFTFIAGFICAFVLGWKVALVMLSILPLMGFGAGLLGKAVQEVQNETQSWYGKAAAVVEECLYSMRTVVAFGGEKRELVKFSHAVHQARRGGVRNGVKVGGGMGYLMLIIFCGYALAFYFGMYLRYNEEINPSTGKVWEPGRILSVFFCVFVGSFMVGNIDPGVKAFREGRQSAGRFFTILEGGASIQCRGADERKVLTDLQSFEFRGVHFNYPARPGIKVLNGLNLSIGRGQKVAFVGESGSGKSTIMSLLERFYDPTEGVVLVNGEDVRNFAVLSLRKQIGYVGQEPVLFATTIRENILQGNPQASPEDLDSACHQAQLTFLENLPDGLDTFVGSGGSQFSGGQKQRIAIARALLKKAPFLFLDEATSALDNASEKMIQATIDSISEHAGGLSIVSIAHRLSTIRNSDVIFVLKNGVVVEQGNHEALMKLQGTYYALAASQESAAKAAAEAAKEAGQEGGNENELQLPQLPKYVSATNITHAVTPAAKREDAAADEAAKTKLREQEIAKNYKVPMYRLLGYNRPEWPWFVPALIGSLADGAAMPGIALVLVQSMTSFFKEKETMRTEMQRVCLIFVLIGIANLVSSIISQGSFAVLGEAMTSRLRVEMLTALFRQEIGFHDDPEHTPGMMAKALELYAYRVSSFVKTIGVKAQAVSSIVFGLTAAFVYCWQMALVMLASVPITVAAQAVQMLVMVGATKNENDVIKRAQQVISESVQNSRTVQACGNEKELLALYTQMANNAVKGFVVRNIATGIGFGISSGMMFFILAGGFYYAGTLVKNGDADFQEVMTAFMGIFYAGMGAGQAAAMVTDATKAKVACHDMFALIDRVSAIDGLHPDGRVPTEPIQAGRIELENVEFFYPFRPQVQVLKGISFIVTPGQSVGLVGPSGGGKSTVMAMLQRFYDPVNGTVFIGEQRTPLHELDIRWWRRQIGFVGQEPVLFNTSVRENVMYGIDDGEQISEEFLEECKKMANLDFLDKENSQGWATEVGPRGNRLSGGQKQRVAICRALVRNPSVLLLDEATSALDTQSEKVVQDALEAARKGRTSFAIAHRLSTISGSDVIIVVAEGRVLEYGNHDELMKIQGLYFKLQKQSHK